MWVVVTCYLGIAECCATVAQDPRHSDIAEDDITVMVTAIGAS